jgi:hypothetical protein
MGSRVKSAVGDKRLSELPGVSPAAVVALERVGFLSCSDLVAADFHRVAYILDDYNEATRLVREARRACGLENGTGKDAPDPLPPGPLTSTVVNRQRVSAKVGPASTPTQTPPLAKGDRMGLSAALGVLSIGLNDPAGGDRDALRRRMGVMMNLLEHGASESELVAAGCLEAVESGALEVAELAQELGRNAVSLVEECMTLRAVPVLPTGRLPPMFVSAARNASPEARRVCAAHLVLLASTGGDPSYMKLHLEALRAGGTDDIVEAAAAAVRETRRAA